MRRSSERMKTWALPGVGGYFLPRVQTVAYSHLKNTGILFSKRQFKDILSTLVTTLHIPKSFILSVSKSHLLYGCPTSSYLIDVREDYERMLIMLALKNIDGYTCAMKPLWSNMPGSCFLWFLKEVLLSSHLMLQCFLHGWHEKHLSFLETRVSHYLL